MKGNENEATDLAGSPGSPGSPGAKLIPTPAVAAAWCVRERAAGRTSGLVPTMGALHEGHLHLVRRAVAENDHAVVSVFVNPLQFDDSADLVYYPRDLARDVQLVGGVGCSMVFTGTLAGFFPEAVDLAAASGSELMKRIPLVDPGPAALGLEGACRRGHFEGVATIVKRLFQIVQPTRAYFGAKDYQQTAVVRALVPAGGEPEVIVCATQREDSGLAGSSRNQRLSVAQIELATALSRGLFAARAAWHRGQRDPATLVAALEKPLRVDGIEVEYAEVRDPDRWTEERPTDLTIRARALVAARIGPVRLIDNMALDEMSVRAEEGDAAWDLFRERCVTQ